MKQLKSVKKNMLGLGSMSAWALVLLLTVAAVPSGFSEAVGAQEPQGLEAGMDKSIFLDLRDINVIDVFKFLAVQGNLNIVTSKNVQGRSTLLLRDVKIKDALDILALSNQLAYETRNMPSRTGKILMTKKRSRFGCSKRRSLVMLLPRFKGFKVLSGK
jgi:hypothetical protein